MNTAVKPVRDSAFFHRRELERLWVVSGRIPFDDDDTVHFVVGANHGEAVAEFRRLMLDEDPDASAEDSDDDEDRLYINFVSDVASEADTVRALLGETAEARSFGVYKHDGVFYTRLPADMEHARRGFASEARAWMEAAHLRHIAYRVEPIDDPVRGGHCVWEGLSDINTKDNGDGVSRIDEPFGVFEADTAVEAIWHWIEAHFEVSVARLMRQG